MMWLIQRQQPPGMWDRSAVESTYLNAKRWSGLKTANIVKEHTFVWVDGHLVFLPQLNISVRSPSRLLAFSCSELLGR